MMKLLKTVPAPQPGAGVNTTTVCMIRLVHQITTDSRCMEQLARTPVTECLLRAAHPLHVDTAFVLESLLKVRCISRSGDHME